MNKTQKRKSAQAFLAVMFLIFGLLIVISAVGSSEFVSAAIPTVEPIPFIKFIWSIIIGLCLMAIGCLLADGVKK